MNGNDHRPAPDCKYCRTAINNVRVLFMLALIISSLRCVQYLDAAPGKRQIRIALLADVQNVTVSGRIKNKYKKGIVITPDKKFPITVTAHKGLVMVNSKPFRGDLNINLIKGKIWVINVLDIEDYLPGVVPCEIGKVDRRLIEAAKAQAIAARTYAVAHIDHYAGMGFDLYATVRDQVYNGYDTETEITNQAVAETERQIIIHDDRPIEAKYHSTCGGITADFSDAWAGAGPVYLRSVVCPYCTKSPHHQWKKTLSKSEFFLRLRAGMKKIGVSMPPDEKIINIRLTRNRISSRIRKMTVVTKKREYVLTNYQIRAVFGEPTDPGSLMKSNCFDILVQDDSITINGRGFGHGVGMCQFGAIEMARQGFNHRQILMHYYPGTRIVKY